MHVEKGDALAFAKFPAFNIVAFASNLAQAADGNVAGNQWIGNALQASLLKVNVRLRRTPIQIISLAG